MNVLGAFEDLATKYRNDSSVHSYGQSSTSACQAVRYIMSEASFNSDRPVFIEY